MDLFNYLLKRSSAFERTLRFNASLIKARYRPRASRLISSRAQCPARKTPGTKGAGSELRLRYSRRRGCEIAGNFSKARFAFQLPGEEAIRAEAAAVR